MKTIVASAGMCALLFLTGTPAACAEEGNRAAPRKLYNTAKQKLKEGKTIIGATVLSLDPNIYCAVANAGFDCVMIEMQHSTITYADAAQMIFACREAPAMTFIRVPDATESDIQKATDIGALGVIVPTDTGEGRRSGPVDTLSPGWISKPRHRPGPGAVGS